MKENIQLIQRVYEAFNKRNYTGVLEMFAPGMIWLAADNSPLADRSPYSGIDVIHEGVFQRIAAGFERLIVQPDEMIDAGEKVVVLGYYHGQIEGKSDSFQAQVAHIWTIDRGKVVKFQQYMDTYRISQVVSGSA